MSKFIHPYTIRRALHGLLVVVLALTGLPTGSAENRSRQGRGDDVRDDDNHDETRVRNRIKDCFPTDREFDDREERDAGNDGDDERDRDNGNRGGRNKPECLPRGSSSGVARGDFNGDGVADLAIGVPGEDVPAGRQDSGAVNVIYGSFTDGLTTDATLAPPARMWHQGSAGVPDSNEDDDRFGSALAAGDFNGDNFSDLAIGVPLEDITVPGLFGPTTHENAGGVMVIYGSPQGLAAGDGAILPAKFLDFTQGGMSDKLKSDDHLGRSLAWGDFNGDDIGDLAIGAAFRTEGFFRDGAGAIWVLFGSRDNGLTTDGNQFWTQEDAVAPSDPVVETSELLDHFGISLAAGDFDGDGASDLAIGVPFEDGGLFGLAQESGRVVVLYGSEGVGLANTRAQNWLPGAVCTDGDFERLRFGDSLAAGDFNGDNRADLAIGMPGEALQYQESGFPPITRPVLGLNVGAVCVLYGEPTGLGKTLLASQHWTQNFAVGQGGFRQRMRASAPLWQPATSTGTVGRTLRLEYPDKMDRMAKET